jgi:hypothetical protein
VAPGVEPAIGTAVLVGADGAEVEFVNGTGEIEERVMVCIEVMYDAVVVEDIMTVVVMTLVEVGKDADEVDSTVAKETEGSDVAKTGEDGWYSPSFILDAGALPGPIFGAEPPVAQLPVAGASLAPLPVRTYLPGFANCTSLVSTVLQSF